MFLFSSKTIPGNEVAVWPASRTRWPKSGVDDRSTSSHGFYHVSGHANRPDIEAMHDILRPQHRRSPATANTATCANMRNWRCPSAAWTGIIAANGIDGGDLGQCKPGIVDYIEVGQDLS
jgi:ribonuclease J